MRHEADCHSDMYHSGYLTIDGAEDGIVSLRIPNEEIADSISHGYIAF